MSARVPAGSVRSRPRRLLVTVGIAAALAVGIDRIGDATQVRPEILVAGSSTEVTLDFRTRQAAIAPSAVLPSVLEQCRSRLHRPQYTLTAGTLSADRYLVRSTPALGKHSVRKLTGCFEDLIVDFVVVDVVGVRSLPPPG